MVHRSRATALAAFAAILMLPSLGAAQEIAPVSAPTAATLVMSPATVSGPTAAPSTMSLDNAVGPLTTARAVGLQRQIADSATSPLMTLKKARNNDVTLMVVGLAAILVGTVVDGDTGTVIVLTGAGIGLVGLYRYLSH